MILLDTSVWITYLRNPEQIVKRQSIERYIRGPLASLELATCGVILYELTQGAKTAQQRLDVARIQEVCEYQELGAEDYLRGGEISRSLLAKNKKLPLSDILIAVCALKYGLTLVSADQDFSLISLVEPKFRYKQF